MIKILRIRDFKVDIDSSCLEIEFDSWPTFYLDFIENGKEYTVRVYIKSEMFSSSKLEIDREKTGISKDTFEKISQWIQENWEIIDNLIPSIITFCDLKEININI